MAETDKSDKQQAKETSDAVKAQQEADAQRLQDDAEVKVDEAQAALDTAEQEAEEAEAAAKGGGKHGKFTKGEAEDLEEEQIRTGRAPIAAGPEEAVDPHKAWEAKQNRGRGLG